jgi:hypothetical protein
MRVGDKFAITDVMIRLGPRTRQWRPSPRPSWATAAPGGRLKFDLAGDGNPRFPNPGDIQHIAD